MQEAIERWFDEAAACPAVLGCGARLADRSIAVRTCNAKLAEAQLTGAMREIANAWSALQQNHVTAERLCWTFENARIHCVCRPGGIMGALVVSPEEGNSPEIQHLLETFAAI